MDTLVYNRLIPIVLWEHSYSHDRRRGNPAYLQGDTKPLGSCVYYAPQSIRSFGCHVEKIITVNAVLPISRSYRIFRLACARVCGTKLLINMDYGKGASGPIRPLEDKGDTVCYSCQSPIYYKRAHKRRRNGVDIDVTAHFAHKPGSTCNGESVEHLAAKDALVKHAHKWRFVSKCHTCSNLTQIHVIDGPVRLEEEVKWNKFILDVGVLDIDGNVTGAFEVLKTHAVPLEKATALTDGGLAWCELRADDVLSMTNEEIVCTQSGAPLLCSACETVRNNLLAKVICNRITKEIETATDARMAAAQSDLIDTFIHRQIDPFGLTTDQVQSIITHFKVGGPLDYKCLTAITGFTPPADALTKVRTKWNRMVATLKLSLRDSPLKFAAQQLNQKIVDASDKQFGVDDVVAVTSAHPNDVIRFGKYSGSTFEQVAELDIKYIRYLARWTGDRDLESNKPAVWSHPHGEFQQRARLALRGHCLNCFNGTLVDWKHWCSKCY